MDPSTTPRPAPKPSPGRQGRLDSIDFWRGLVLCTIFINHIPGNLFERFTHRNYGLSDSAEAFVFLSGVSLALAYGRHFARGAGTQVALSLVRRSAKLYGVHLLLTLGGLAVFAFGAAALGNPDILQQHGRDLFVDDLGAALIGTVSLGHQLGYFNILPMYVLLVLMVPAMLWLSRFGEGVMLVASLALYAAVRAAHLNLPSWPMRGEWFFDPLAWQFLLAIGVAVGLNLRDRPIARRPLLAAASAVVVALGVFVSTDGLSVWPGLNAGVHAWGDVDKTMLGTGRLIHFLGLAYLTYWLDPIRAMRRAAWYRPLCLVGRRSLLSFACVSLMAAVGQILGEAFGHSLGTDTVLIGGGLALLYGVTIVGEKVAQLATSPSLRSVA